MRLLQSVIWLAIALTTGAFLPKKLIADGTLALNESRIQSAGIRKLASDHLVLYTDVPSSLEVDRLPAIFDRAIPQWAGYFKIDEIKAAKWQARAFLVGDARRFGALKLLPAGHEDFENGISSGSDIWLRDQPSDYYRRHLLLHEGTHAFMFAFLGGCGPGWYMEGTAELLGTHRFDEKFGALTLGIMPRTREEVPMLGRIKLIRDAVAAHRALTFPAVMQLDTRKQLGSEAYAWCWSVAKFLDASPRYRDRFRQLRRVVNEPKFNEIFREKFAADWSDLNAEWQAYIATIDYGYDFDRMAIDFASHALMNVGRNDYLVNVGSTRGWQSSGVRLEAGKSYRVIAKGRYQIAVEQVGGKSQPWICEPGGVTIEYNDGYPLGMLLGAIEPDDETSRNADASFVKPIAIGIQSILTPTKSGMLFLRVNESAAHLGDNRGALSVAITRAP